MTVPPAAPSARDIGAETAVIPTESVGGRRWRQEPHGE
ncbi:hypothetical protein MINT15_04880 [Saccharomonospora viridis]|uniref:Uncharacterized protein n=1 Tax=Saccharomonospora viridis TaxID=1852 RepID=A0A837DFG7_9PSEU|nr:hypothetical protein MINT15_04880 [Saccharomonospora viridis]